MYGSWRYLAPIFQMALVGEPNHYIASVAQFWKFCSFEGLRDVLRDLNLVCHREFVRELEVGVTGWRCHAFDPRHHVTGRRVIAGDVCNVLAAAYVWYSRPNRPLDVDFPVFAFRLGD